MKKKKKSNPDKLSERSSKKYKDENPDEGHPNPDNPFEGTAPRIKGMPITGHPHREEIMD